MGGGSGFADFFAIRTLLIFPVSGEQACTPSFLLCWLGALRLATQCLCAPEYQALGGRSGFWAFAELTSLQFLDMLVLSGYVRITES